MTNAAEQWDAYYRGQGHTGCAEACIYKYDQRLRMRAFGKVIDASVKASSDIRALDVGCGTGNVVALLRRRGYRVTGIDISPAVAADTARRFASDDSVEIRPGAIEDAALGETRFDLITSVTVLQHIMDARDLEKALRNLGGAVKPDGVMFALEIAPAWRMSASKLQAGVVERTAAEWRMLFASSGWRVDSERCYAPWGPVLVHQFDRMVGRIVGPRSPTDAAPLAIGQSPIASEKRSFPKRILRAVFRGARKCILLASWPLDHVLRLPGPAHFAYYRSFILRPA